jgi:type IV pilus assembly protein PilC
MPTYTYIAMDTAGQQVDGEIDAATVQEAIAQLRSTEYFPVKIREKGMRLPSGGSRPGAAKRRKGTGFGRVKVKQLTQFTRQLSTLTDAGLPILRSIRILEQQQKPGKLRLVLRQVAEDVEGGATLSEAFGRHSGAFDRLYVNMVAAGETGGVLDTILARLAEFLEKSQRLKRKVIGAMIYPAVVITFAGGIVMGIMLFVVPKFTAIFTDFRVKLPQVTQSLLDISNWFLGRREYAPQKFEDVFPPGWAIVLATPVILWLLYKLVRLFYWGRYILDVVKIKIPIVGKIISKSSIARFTRTLGTLIGAGVPILEAIKITKDTSGNEVYARALGRVHDAIREGESFAAPLRASRVVDNIVVNMVDVGEETGELDNMLIKIADNYDEEVEVVIGSLVSIMEPLMVILLGGIVGFIVVALFMPMVALIQNLGGGG